MRTCVVRGTHPYITTEPRSPLGDGRGEIPPAGITHPDGVRLTAVAVNEARVRRGRICGANAKPAPIGGAKRSGAYSASRGASQRRRR